MAVSIATAVAAAAAASQKLSPLTTPPHDKPFCSSFSKTLLKPCHPVTHTRKVHWTGVSAASKNPISDIVSDVSDDYDDKPREECGVVGIYGDPEASRMCYLALHALQHRGQEGAGIVSVHDNVLKSITGVGLVSDVFNESKLAFLRILVWFLMSLMPSEVLVVDKDGVGPLCLMSHLEPKSCIFENIYFSLPNSVVFGKSVYESRRAFGEILATVFPVDF